MTTKQVSFTEIIKWVHPDTNPNISNSGEKVAQVVRNKNNPSYLYNLAVQWGFIKDNTHRTEQEKTRIGIMIGVVIRYNGLYRAVVIDVQNGKGKKRGFYKIFFADVTKRKVLYTFLPNLDREYNNFSVLGKADNRSKEIATQLYDNYKAIKRSNRDIRQEYKRDREERAKEFIRPNRNYENEDIWVYARTLGKRIKVTRTTNKRVYYWCNRTEKERFVNFSGVRGI